MNMLMWGFSLWRTAILLQGEDQMCQGTPVLTGGHSGSQIQRAVARRATGTPVGDTAEDVYPVWHLVSPRWEAQGGGEAGGGQTGVCL